MEHIAPVTMNSVTMNFVRQWWPLNLT